MTTHTTPSHDRIRVILDTDTNNELDDQHAIAYMLFNSDVFEVEGITSNKTENGGGIEMHTEEARRVVELCACRNKIEIRAGADKNYPDIKDTLSRPDFDGCDAVDFIIRRAREFDGRKLALVAIGKLTNIALALAKDPGIVPLVKVVWLGSAYPDVGSYNMGNDPEAVNPVLASGVEFAVCTERSDTGTAAVLASQAQIHNTMPGLGPKIFPPVPGRSGGVFSCFGDYSVDLFDHVTEDLRPLYDVCALAILKNPAWATPVTVSGFRAKGSGWEETGEPFSFTLWKDWDRQGVLEDFFASMKHYVLPA
jgi:inosine-uridine nucleoside N-ribohydrolase